MIEHFGEQSVLTLDMFDEKGWDILSVRALIPGTVDEALSHQDALLENIITNFSSSFQRINLVIMPNEL